MTDKTASLHSAMAAAFGEGDHHAERVAIRAMFPVSTPSGRGESKKPMAVRLLNRVRFGASECWHWCGPTNTFGYGRMTHGGRLQVAHRLSWAEFKGPIPDGISVLHTCDNPSCINPNHLWLGTYSDNIRDAWAKGRNKGRTGHKRNAQ